MIVRHVTVHSTVMALLSLSIAAAQAPADQVPRTVNEAYPGLTWGGLSHATLSGLPEGVLLRSGSTEITLKELDYEIGEAPPAIKEEVKKNAFYLLEQMATKAIVLSLAKQQTPKSTPGIDSKPETELLKQYVDNVTSQVQVTDDEVTAFYEENKDSLGGAPLDQVKDQLKQYVLREKQQTAFQEHLRTLGQRVPIEVSAEWIKQQEPLARDNPVDKARASGKPTMVDFGADGCRPCEMMAPILAELTNQYQGKANILFVHARKDQILANRYGIRAIPVQVFFDKNGNETWRHVGFFPKEEIEKKLAELGAV